MKCRWHGRFEVELKCKNLWLSILLCWRWCWVLSFFCWMKFNTTREKNCTFLRATLCIRLVISAKVWQHSPSSSCICYVVWIRSECGFPLLFLYIFWSDEMCKQAVKSRQWTSSAQGLSAEEVHSWLCICWPPKCLFMCKVRKPVDGVVEVFLVECWKF